MIIPKTFVEMIKFSPSDSDEERRSKLLNLIVSTIGILAALIGVFGLIVGGDDPGIIFIYITTPILALGCLGIIVINKRGNNQTAALIFIIFFTLAAAFSDLPREVVLGRSLFVFIAPILIASFIITPHASYYLAGLSALMLYIVSTTANIPMNWIAAMGFFSFAVLSWLVSRTLENALIELRLINVELDQRVEARTQELAEANEKLTELDMLKSKFVSDVSHELRTPIGNITLYLEMLEHGNPLKSESYLEVLKGDTARLSELVEKTLDLSRLESGDANINMEWVDLNVIVENVVIANRPRAIAENLFLSFIPDITLPPIWADSDQLSQIATNLIVNAISYTSQGRIEVRTYQLLEEGKVCLQVDDTGVGIPSEDLPYMFDRFYRGSNAAQSSIPGSGLGLAITKEVVELHQGSIDVQSVLGKGTTFVVSLPLKAISPDT